MHNSLTTLSIFTLIIALCVYNLIISAKLIKRVNNNENVGVSIEKLERTYTLFFSLLTISVGIVGLLLGQNQDTGMLFNSLMNNYTILLFLITSVVFLSFSINTFQKTNETDARSLVIISSILLSVICVGILYLGLAVGSPQHHQKLVQMVAVKSQ